MNRTVRGTSLLSAALLSVLSARDALAQSVRVVVGPVTGERAEIARVTTRQALTGHPEIERIDDRSVAGLAAATNDAQVVSAARAAGAQYVIVGDITPRDLVLVMRLRALRVRDGVAVRTANWELQELGEVPALSEEIWQKLSSFLLPETAPAVIATPTQNPIATTATTATTVTTTVEPPHAQGPGDHATPGLGIVSISAGAGLAQRFWRMPVLGDVASRGYENAGYPELHLEATVFGRENQHRKAIGLTVGANLPFSISSRGTDPTGVLTTLPTRSLELTAGVIGAIRPEHGGLFKLNLGFVFHDFGLDTSKLAPEKQLGSMTYVGFRAAAEGVVPLFASAKWELGVLFGAEARVTVMTDARTKQLFGEYSSIATGFGGTAGLSVRLDGALPGLELRLFAQMVRYRVGFSGRATIGNGSDSVDDYVRVQGMLSWAIGTVKPSRRE